MKGVTDSMETKYAPPPEGQEWRYTIFGKSGTAKIPVGKAPLDVLRPYAEAVLAELANNRDLRSEGGKPCSRVRSSGEDSEWENTSATKSIRLLTCMVTIFRISALTLNRESLRYRRRTPKLPHRFS